MHGTPIPTREALLHETDCGYCKQPLYVLLYSTDIFYFEAVQLKHIDSRFTVKFNWLAGPVTYGISSIK